MAYATPRSVNQELHLGSREGGIAMIGKDWGGPHDGRSRPPLAAEEAPRGTPGQD